MGIIAFNTKTTGLVGETIQPRRCTMVTTDSLATITTAGYLNNQNANGNPILPTDIFDVLYDFNPATQAGTYGIFQVTYAAATGFSLNAWENAANVLLPVIANHIATFNGTSGQIKSDAATAINSGNIQAGLSGTAGYFATFPSTAATGSLRLVAASNAGNTVTQITNASFAQASVLTIPDPGATANFVLRPAALVNNNLVKASGVAGLVADAGARLISNTTAVFAGGGTTNSFAAVGLTAAAKGSAVIRTSTNAVSITSAVPGTDTLDITFSADPGAGTTVDYIYTSALQA